MTWLKRNLLLVVGGVVALALLGGAVWFLLTSKQKVDEVTGQLTTQTDELKRLVTRNPHPNPDNIELAKKEQVRLADFLGRTRQFFVPASDFGKVESADFKRLLDTTIAQLEHDAEETGVKLPDKYNFTFSAQRNRLDFAADALVPLATQVMEIKALCDVLFNSRVHRLVSLRRAAVAKEEENATDYLIGKKTTTNAVANAVINPYEITFQGFSTELASVLEGLYRSSNCFIVKNIDVQTNVVAELPGGDVTSPYYTPFYVPPTGATPLPATSPGEMMRRRYGIDPSRRPMPERYEGVAPPAPTLAPTIATSVRRGPETVLDERPFKVTMFVEAVRLVEPAKPVAAK